MTDGRFPAVWDANYARIDVPTSDLNGAEVERELIPALERAGSDTFHAVIFHPESMTRVLTDLSTRGYRLDWDVVMELRTNPEDQPHEVRVEGLNDGPDLWEMVHASLNLFGTATSSPGAVEQLQRIEREVFGPGGKRWFVARGHDGRVASLAALLVLDGVAYLDNVATFPESRGKGFASAVTAHITRLALAEGASVVSLLADPDSHEVVRLYRRLGFREAGRLASLRGRWATTAG